MSDTGDPVREPEPESELPPAPVLAREFRTRPDRCRCAYCGAPAPHLYVVWLLELRACTEHRAVLLRDMDLYRQYRQTKAFVRWTVGIRKYFEASRRIDELERGDPA